MEAKSSGRDFICNFLACGREASIRIKMVFSSHPLDKNADLCFILTVMKERKILFTLLNLVVVITNAHPALC
jgi:hypothetical protein